MTEDLFTRLELAAGELDEEALPRLAEACREAIETIRRLEGERDALQTAVQGACQAVVGLEVTDEEAACQPVLAIAGLHRERDGYQRTMTQAAREIRRLEKAVTDTQAERDVLAQQLREAQAALRQVLDEADDWRTMDGGRAAQAVAEQVLGRGVEAATPSAGTDAERADPKG